MKDFINNVVAVLMTVALFVVGLAVFSYFGMVPEALSLPLPWHSPKVMLIETARDIREERYGLMEARATAKAGKKIFDNICAEDPYSADIHLSVDKDKRVCCYLTSEGESYVRRKKTDEFKPLSGGISFYSKQDRLVLMEDKTMLIGRIMDLKANPDDYLVDMDGSSEADASQITALLKKQASGRITNNELSTLLFSRAFGDLIGWFPEEDTAIFSIDGCFLRVNVQTGEETEISNPYAGEGAEAIGCTDGETVYLNVKNQSVVKFDLINEEEEWLDLDPFDAVSLYQAKDGLHVAVVKKPSEQQIEEEGTDQFKYCIIYSWETGEIEGHAQIRPLTVDDEIYCTKKEVFVFGTPADESEKFHYVAMEAPWEE